MWLPIKAPLASGPWVLPGANPLSSSWARGPGLLLQAENGARFPLGRLLPAGPTVRPRGSSLLVKTSIFSQLFISPPCFFLLILSLPAIFVVFSFRS